MYINCYNNTIINTNTQGNIIPIGFIAACTGFATACGIFSAPVILETKAKSFHSDLEKVAESQTERASKEDVNETSVTQVLIRTENLHHMTESQKERFVNGQQALLASTLSLRLPEELSHLSSSGWNIELSKHRDWFPPDPYGYSARATINPVKLEAFLESTVVPLIPEATHLHILSSPTEESVHVALEGMPHDGWKLDAKKAALEIATSITSGQLHFVLPVQKVKGEIRNETTIPLGNLQLLAQGRSDFAGSVPNRIFNIEKALKENITGVLIPKDTKFSFADIFEGKKVSLSNGWKLSLGIFNDENLVPTLIPTPGGGICQTTTTLFRAAVLAGLPIVERRNHSMYVNYYRKYGEGLDATYFEKSVDFSFLNDTGGPLLLLGYTEGTDAIIEIYGTDDGRNVSLDGPYRYHDAPVDVRKPEGESGMRSNDIAWKQVITRADSTAEENVYISRYRTVIPYRTSEDAKIVITTETSPHGEEIVKIGEST